MSKNKARDAWRLIEAALRVAKSDEARGHLENIQTHTEVDDFDFDEEVVAVGNWNEVTKYDEAANKFDTIDDTPKRLCKALEAIGVGVAWGDCTTTCDECSKLLNTEPSSYGWQPRFVATDYGVCCEECLDPVEHLESLEGNSHRTNNVASIDPEEHEYFLFEGGMEHGFHPGQDANPQVIAKAMRERGITRFLFNVDDIGQFDMRFSVYVHEDERELVEGQLKLSRTEIDGPSVSGALDRGLREASVASAALVGEGVKYVSIEGDKVVEARVIPPEEFAKHGTKCPHSTRRAVKDGSWQCEACGDCRYEIKQP